MQTIEEALNKLSRSRFRSSFHLTAKDRQYVREKGMDTIRRHAGDFVAGKLAPADPEHGGRQTPMKGHPVFKAQHACACCCRGCLHKWYKVDEHTELSEIQIDKITNLLMAWIEEEMNEK